MHGDQLNLALTPSKYPDPPLFSCEVLANNTSHDSIATDEDVQLLANAIYIDVSIVI